MNALVVYGHPHAGSFSAALRDQVVGALEAGGHQVTLIDLWAEGFDPRLSAEEVRTHRAGIEARPAVATHAAALRAAELLVFVYPTWWGGPPAMVKGWLDRVLCAGVAFELPDGADRVTPLLRHIRRLVVVTTYGSSRWINALQGEPGRRTFNRGLRTLCARRLRVTWLGLYRMDRNGDADRNAFLERVAEELGGLRA